MTNFNSAVEATSTAYNSAGSSARENERYLDSIEGKLKAFDSAWEQLSFHVVSSSFLTDVIELGTKVISVFDSIAETIGGVPTLLLGGGAWGLIPKIISSVTTSIGERGLVGTAKAAGSAFKDLGSQVRTAFDTVKEVGVGSILKELAASPAVMGAAFAGVLLIAEKLRKELSFEGQLEDVTQIDADIEGIKAEIDALNSTGDELSEAEKVRLNLLESQLKVMERQRDIEIAEAQKAFEEEAEAQESQGYAGDKGTTAEQYVTTLKEMRDLADAIQETEDTSTLTVEEKEKRIKRLSDRYNDILKTNTKLSEEIIAQEEGLKELSYDELSDSGKQYYDSIHSAFLMLQNDNSEIQDVVGRVIQTVGSAEFDSWELDLSSFKTADELIAAIKEKWEDPTEAEVDFVENGADDVEAKGNEVARPRDAYIGFDDNSTIGDLSKRADAAAGERHSTITFSDGGTLSSLATGIQSIRTSAEQAAEALKQGHAKGKKQGEAGGLAWIGDEAKPGGAPRPEIIQHDDGTAELAGTTGWELREIKASDRVYSYSETKKLLGGKMVVSGKLPRYAKGKKKSKRQKKIDNLRDAYDAAVDTLDYKDEYQKWSDSKYLKELKSTYLSYKKKLKAIKSNLSTDQIRDYNLQVQSLKADAAQERIDSLIGAVGYTGNTKAALDKINKARKNKYLTAKEAKTLKADVYKENLDYIAKEVSAGRKSYAALEKAAAEYQKFVAKGSQEYLESIQILKEARTEAAEKALNEMAEQVNAGKKSYADLLKTAKTYWKEVGEKSEAYYESLATLREAEAARLEAQSEKSEDKISYLQQYISLQIDELERQKEVTNAVEEENEARANLLKAQNTYVRVYKEGIGWTYEQDADAIRDASKALKELHATEEDDPVQQQIDKYNEILDLFDRYEAEADFIALQNKLGINGINDVLNGSVLDKNFMAGWLQDQYTWLNGLDAWLVKLDNMSNKDYEKYASTGITDNMLKNMYNTYAYGVNDVYAASTLNAGIVAGKSGTISAGVIDGVTLAAIDRAISSGGNNYYFGDLTLPNVTDAQSFVDELQKLTSKAIQDSTKR